jgi:hypothetical protein
MLKLDNFRFKISSTNNHLGGLVSGEGLVNLVDGVGDVVKALHEYVVPAK